jgi:diguanylate cyclase (GGDEF)-like protein
VTVVNTSLGLLAVAVLRATPAAVLLLPLPILIVFLAYRTYVGAHRQAESLDLLNEANLARGESLGVGAATSVLQLARRMFRAEYAELILTAREPALRTTIGPSSVEELRPLAGDPASIVDAALHGRTSRLVGRSQSPGVVLASGRALRDAMVAEVMGSRGRLGVLVVGDRLGDVSQFDAADLRLFETVAHQAGSVIENGQLEASVSQLTEFEQQLRRQDPLTGLANRAFFRSQLESAVNAAGRTFPAVIVVEVDDFKFVNDALGHHSGDALLTQIAGRIRDVAGDAHVAARIGGDEFGILVQGDRALARAKSVANLLAKSLEPPFMIAGQETTIAASCGIATAATPDELLRNADVAMLTAKARGKHQAVVFEQAMLDSLVERHALGADLQRALVEGQFELAYQPVVDLRTMEYVGAEALIRWRHPERGVVAPASFIAIAEETGLIRDIGRSALDEACRTARRWDAPGGARRSVAVNVSYVQLDDPGLVGDVARALERSGLEPWALTLEITESGLLRDSGEAIQRLRQIRAMGVKVAVDDFGTGYSSLSYLRRLPIDQLKIPREFVSAGGPGLQDTVLIGAMLAMGRALGLEVLAEGIEEPAQAAGLREMGCALGQGYLFARPMPEADIAELFASGKATAA